VKPKPPIPEEVIASYMEDCRRRGLAKSTQYARRYILTKVEREVGLFKATPEQLADWLDREIKNSSKATYMASLRAFYEWCVDHDTMTSNPVRKMSKPRVKKRDPAPIDPDELTRALEIAKPVMKAWLLLAAAAGLRCCEIANLKVEDIHLKDEPAWIHIANSKGALERNVPVHIEVEKALVVLKWPVKGRLWRYSAQSISERGNRLLAKAGSESTMHKLRHYAATNYWQALNDAGTPDVLLLTDFLGHASPATSMIYTRRDQRKGAKAMQHFVVGAPVVDVTASGSVLVAKSDDEPNDL
jgi:integrase